MSQIEIKSHESEKNEWYKFGVGLTGTKKAEREWKEKVTRMYYVQL